MLDIKILNSPHRFAANCYLISSAGECAVVDPTCPYAPELTENKVKYVLITHAHFDHILDIDSWAATGAEVILHRDDLPALSDPNINCYKLFDGSDRGFFGACRGVVDGEGLVLGSEQIEVISCPGHTIGSVAYLCGNDAFVGDTVFAGGGYGRFDLPTGDFSMLRGSIKRLAALNDTVIFYPGHGEATTVKQYRQDIGF